MSEDKYDTLEKIGHGSFGVIRKVRRKADGFIMCRKEISYLRMSQKEREQLHAEFQILSHLRHPNIVAYYHREHLKASQDLHLYMEYCGNGDLGRVITDLQHKGQRAQETFVWSIFSQLVMALYRCHYGVDPPEAGANALGLTQGGANGTPKVPAGAMTILHRDLKPENVFLGEDNSVKLGDFGLSKMIKSHDFASTYVGTPFYMSPEICAAEKYTLKSDIWSLGCIIYELCAREPPFNAKTHFQLVQRIKEGKVATLPEMYSPELNQVIRDCLKVSPDRRPDTVQLLNLPIVRLMRKEKEVVDLNKSLKSKEDSIRKREKELNDRLTSLDKEREMMRQEIDASVRREWELKARLEIDRLANDEIERLQKRFEVEVRIRIDAEIKKFKSQNWIKPEDLPTDHQDSLATSRPDDLSSLADEKSSCDLSTLTDAADCSTNTPDASRELKRPGRTPFSRAHTMFAVNAGTPMDVEMASPSPMAIASLSLSPRRNGATKAPVTHSGNIFTANVNRAPLDPRWDLHEPLCLGSDDEEVMPSPTRNVRSAKNPFTSKSRPVLSTQKTAPVVNRSRPQTSGITLVSKAAASGPAETRARSPIRQISKIPSMASLQTDSISASQGRKHSSKRDNHSGDALGKVAAKNSIKGRTLVELQQARAGGRPVSAAGGASESFSPNKRGTLGEKAATDRRTSENQGTDGSSSSNSSSSSSDSNGSSSSSSSSQNTSDSTSTCCMEPVAIWDPEEDEMPSPFLRKTRSVKV